MTKIINVNTENNNQYIENEQYKIEENPKANTALQCFALLCSGYGVSFDGAKFIKRYVESDKEFDLSTILEIAEESDFEASPQKLSWDELKSIDDYPCLAVLKNGNSVIFDSIKDDSIFLIDPLSEKKRIILQREKLEKSWDGQVVFLKPKLYHSLLRGFVMIGKHHGADLSLEGLIHDYALDRDDPNPARFMRIAKEQGFKVKAKKIKFDDLTNMGEAYPALAKLKNGQTIVLCGYLEDSVNCLVDVVDPLSLPLKHEDLTKEQLTNDWDGEIYLFKRNYKIDDEKQPFGLRWFIPEFIRQKKTFIDVGIAAVLMQIIALATPLYFQIVIDKVLVHHSFSTLHILSAGMLIALLFDSAFNFLRSYLLLHGTSKIDIRVATKTLDKLVSLPMLFFDKSAAGVLIKHMQQTDKIREFLTGRLFFTLLDSISLFIFLPILFFYSTDLAIVVLVFSIIIAIFIAILIPRFQRRLQDLYQAEGERQSFLVETIHGIQTVKSLSLEPIQRKKWDRKAATAVTMKFKVGRISISAKAVTNFLEKAMILSIPWIGVSLVFDGQMTVGSLIAFQMIAGRVSGPLVQIVSLIHEYQEAALSVRMLGNIMNQRPERDSTMRGLRPKINGNIAFEHIIFKYAPDIPPALNDVSVSFTAGSMIGIVGRSGSGKSTLVRLLQGLYHYQEGIVRIDGHDIREIDLPHLRQNIGVVLQDNFLFHGTVKENISLTKTNASFEEVVYAAKLAGADEFIEKLQKGYDTMLEENGSNLSGGQKQRLAIARALLTQPRILIFDEATSALDAESEAIIQNNLKQIAKGRTTIIISHRLSMLVASDSILVMEHGKIIDNAPHNTLLNGCEPYKKLWNSQNRHIL